MEFRFTDEQQMIRETADAFLADISTSAAVRGAMQTDAGFDAAVWSRVCNEMGWPAMVIPEAYGGLSLGFVELVAMLEQMGRYLFCSPFYSTVAFGVMGLRLFGDESQQSLWLPSLAEGQTATLVYDAFAGTNGIEVECRAEDDGYLISGDARFVLNGHTADVLLVIAECGDDLAAFYIDADNPAIQRARVPTMDQTRPLAAVTFDNLRVDSGARLPRFNAQTLQSLEHLAAIAMAAEQLGGAQQSLDSAVAYTGERVQFGRAIASYQAIKHKAADMMLKVEASRSAVYYAACIADEYLNNGALAVELPEAACAAKGYCSDAFFFCAGSSLQMHGGVGFTEEYDIQLYFKRARSSESYLGNGAVHRERIAAMLLDEECR